MDLCNPLLRSASKEGSHAALVLARLFARKDGVERLDRWFDWARGELDEGMDVGGRENVHLVSIPLRGEYAVADIPDNRVTYSPIVYRYIKPAYKRLDPPGRPSVTPAISSYLPTFH
jgi:hypothetical protein